MEEGFKGPRYGEKVRMSGKVELPRRRVTRTDNSATQETAGMLERRRGRCLRGRTREAQGSTGFAPFCSRKVLDHRQTTPPQLLLEGMWSAAASFVVVVAGAVDLLERRCREAKSCHKMEWRAYWEGIKRFEETAQHLGSTQCG